MKNDNKIVITKERREDMIDAIKVFFPGSKGKRSVI
jgi:hypothetical protein